MNLKDRVLQFITEIVAEKPDWVGDIVLAIQAGIKLRLEQEATARVSAEVGLVRAWEDRKGEFIEREEIKKRVLRCWTIFGSPFWEELNAEQT
jgi:hypothetical protein